ncbi:MAG TPA: hypothetical protein VHS32_07875, partial [Streptosporangiaceae bacterium]|nr:hypothetical protein [Streptosporangiaceae bacterium]
MIRDVVSDLTALLLPLPTIPAPGAGDDEREVWSMVADQVQREREELAEQLRLAWEEGEVDPLLGEVAAARRQMVAAE